VKADRGAQANRGQSRQRGSVDQRQLSDQVQVAARSCLRLKTIRRRSTYNEHYLAIVAEARGFSPHNTGIPCPRLPPIGIQNLVAEWCTLCRYHSSISQS